jgi:putative membrane protein
MALWWLLGIALIVLVVVAIMRLSGAGQSGSRESALDILKKRYARGEIDKEEYERLRRDLE